MARYKKGVNTCNYIISVSKKLFYEKGYSQTTIQQICDECNITLGNFTYYFKTKQDLLKRIYQNFSEEIGAYLDENFVYNFTFLEKITIISFVYNYKILQDEVCLHFHLKMLNDNSLFEFIVENLLKDLYLPSAKESDIDMNEKELKLLYYSTLGLNRELTIKYIETGIFHSHLDFCLNSSSITSNMFKFNYNFVTKFLNEYPEFLSKLKAADLNLLK